MMNDDMELLRQYATQRSEQAFETLVSRHLALVYSSALRQVRDPHLAEEISQAVFIILAQKAKSMSAKTVIAGWLYRTTRFTAFKAMQKQGRRQLREQKAYMQSTINDISTEDAWQELSPLLDETMERLGRVERDALVLRYLENKSFQEVGAALGLESSAAQKRVSRGLERLRVLFAQRGVMLSAVAIGGAMVAHSAQAAPLGMTVVISAAAAKGISTATPATALVKETLHMITKMKIKYAIGMTVAALFAGGAVTVAISRARANDAAWAIEVAKKSQAAYAALDSYSDEGFVSTSGGGSSTRTTFNLRLRRPNLYHADWTSTGGFYTGAGMVWSDGKSHFFVDGRIGNERTADPEKMRDMQFAMSAAGSVSASSASTIPEIFFEATWGDLLSIVGLPVVKTKREPDEKAGQSDCVVISYVMAPMKLPKNMGSTGKITTRLWICKQDYLIRKVQQITEQPDMPFIRPSDDAVRYTLAEKNVAATPDAMSAKRAEMEATIRTEMKDTKFVFTQIHENITLNPKFSVTDFMR